MKKLLSVFALAAALTSVAAAHTAAPTPAQTPAAGAMSKELASLQGTWAVASLNNQDLTAQGVEMSLVIDGEKYTIVVNGTVDERGTFKFDPSKKPATFDLSIAEGNDAGKLQMGIIEVTGDVVKGLLAAPGGSTRPANFDSSDGEVFFIAGKIKK